MNRLEKTYIDVSNTQPTTIFTDISQRVRFEYYFTLKAMEEMAWQVWKTLNKVSQGNPTNFDEDRSRELFNEWLKEQV